MRASRRPRSSDHQVDAEYRRMARTARAEVRYEKDVQASVAHGTPLPPVPGGEVFDKLAMPAAERKEAALKVYKEMEQLMIDLSGRWLHEREYEDFADYAKRMSDELSKIEPRARFVRATKRPFSLHFTLGGVSYQLKISGNSYTMLVSG